MKKETYKIKGMHCASCASIIERTVKKIDGVEDISVNNALKMQKFLLIIQKLILNISIKN